MRRRRKKMEVTKSTSETLYCSFCRKDKARVEKLVAGPGVYICDACVALCSRIMTGKPTAPFAGWSALADEELLATLPAASAAADAAADKLHQHGDMLRGRAVGWGAIATA